MTFTGCTDTDILLFSVLSKNQHMAIQKVNKLMNQIMKPICHTWKKTKWHDTFTCFCVANKMEWCLLMKDYWHINYKTQQKAFRSVCHTGQLNVAKWLANLNNIRDIFFNENKYVAFQIACANDQLNVIQWLLTYGEEIKSPINIQDIIHFTFYNACVKGNLHLAQWLFDLGAKNQWSINIHTNHKLVLDVCMNGQLHIVQWLAHLGYMGNINLNHLFRCAISKDHLHVVQWLVNFGDEIHHSINIHEDSELAFIYACIYGHLKTAQWLIQYSDAIHSPIDIHVNNDYIFRRTCAKGHLDVAQWLMTIGNEKQSPIYLHAEDLFHNTAFDLACKNDCLEVAKWLVAYGKEINEPIYIDYDFILRVTKKNVKIIKWLQSMKKKHC